VPDLDAGSGGGLGNAGGEGPSPRVNDAVRLAAEKMRSNPLILGTQPENPPPGSPPAAETKPSGESPSPPSPSPAPAEPNRATEPPAPRSEGEPEKATPATDGPTADEQSKAERYVEMYGGEKVENLPAAAVKALAKALDDNNRLAEMAKGKPPASGKPESEATDTPPSEEEPPQPSGEEIPSDPDALTAWAQQQAMTDPEGVALRQAYQPLVEEAQTLLKTDPQSGQPVGGELFDLSQQLSYITMRLDAEKFGDEPLTDIEREDLQDRQGRLEGRQEVLLNKYDRISRKANDLADRYDARVDWIAKAARDEVTAAQQAEAERAAEAEAAETFNAAMDTAIGEVAAHLTPEDRLKLTHALDDEAFLAVHARGERIGDPKDWVSTHAPAQLSRLGLAQARAVQQVGDQLDRLTQQPAPSGANAVAPPPPQQLSARDRRRAAERATQQAARQRFG